MSFLSFSSAWFNIAMTKIFSNTAFLVILFFLVKIISHTLITLALDSA